MKIFVLNPPFLPLFSRESRSPAVAKSGTLYFPMWLAYAAGFLEKNGHEILFIDAPASGLTVKDICRESVKFNPGMVVLEASTPSIYNDVDVACTIKKEIPAVFTILVGVHVSALPVQTLEEAPQGLNAVAIKEYDATLVELAEKLSSEYNDETLKTIRGIAFKNKSGTVIRNDDRPFIEDLDDLPFVSSVYKKHLNIRPYFYGHSRHPLIVIVTGRGCPFHCTFCVYPQTLQGHMYRKRSIENIVKEFIFIKTHFPEVKEIMIEDDTLTADKKRCRELSLALIDTGVTQIPWSANSRPDVDLETMKLMKKANCRLFCVGFESGDQKILDNIKKATKLSTISTFRNNARKAGILIHGCFMVGNKGESKETLKKTLEMAKRLNPDTAQFYPIMVYPGTEAYEYFNKQGWITTKNYRKWITEAGLHSSVVSNPDLTYEELVTFCDDARKIFYLRPTYIFSKVFQIFTRPGEAKRLFKGFFTLLKYLFVPSLKVNKGGNPESW